MVFVIVTLMQVESIEVDDMNTALASTREVAARAGCDRRTANSAITSLLARGWLAEVGHEGKKARRLRVRGAANVTETGRALDADREHVLWRATDPQVAHHSERTQAVRAWTAEFCAALGIGWRPRGNTELPEHDPNAAERARAAREHRDEQLKESRAERARELKRNAVVRTILGDIPKATESKAVRRHWLRATSDRAAAKIGDRGSAVERRHMRRAIKHALKIRGYELDKAAAIAAHLIPTEGEN